MIHYDDEKDLPERYQLQLHCKVGKDKTFESFHRDAPKPSKYHARKTEYDGIIFDSAAEAKRYLRLKVSLACGEISDLTLQPEYILLPGYTNNKGEKIRPISYRGDFRYIEDGKVVVEDVKGMKTESYKIKKKIFEFQHPEIDFREVK